MHGSVVNASAQVTMQIRPTGRSPALNQKRADDTLSHTYATYSYLTLRRSGRAWFVGV